MYKNYGGFRIDRPEYAQISHCEITPAWTCDISDIHGFAHSKRNLRNFVSMDEMADDIVRALALELSLVTEVMSGQTAHERRLRK